MVDNAVLWMKLSPVQIAFKGEMEEERVLEKGRAGGGHPGVDVENIGASCSVCVMDWLLLLED